MRSTIRTILLLNEEHDVDKFIIVKTSARVFLVRDICIKFLMSRAGDRAGLQSSLTM